MLNDLTTEDVYLYSVIQATIIENYFASSGWAISFSTRDSYTFLPCEGISKKYNYYCRRAPWVISCFEITQGCFTNASRFINTPQAAVARGKFQVYSSWYSYGRCMLANTVWGSCCVHDCLVIAGSRCPAVSANDLVLTFAILRMYASYCHAFLCCLNMSTIA